MLGKQHMLHLQTGICCSGAPALPLQRVISQHTDGGVSITLFKGRGKKKRLLLEMDVTEHKEGHRGQAAWERAILPSFDLLSFVSG